jgi:selenocysteine-specific elongation factor
MTVVVGTAGHIDHGKTALLRALTGIDADRLPEERRRGMTIDVGYAWLGLPDGGEIDFVDVPGHDRLIGNMLVGAGEIDAAMLVVAADDGARAQTIEHLELLDALGVADGLAVITKSDLLAPDDPRRAALRDAVERLLAPTTLAGAQILTVSSAKGDGLAELRAALAMTRDRVLSRAGHGGGAVRLAIDRAFTVRGRGAVVTGTLRGGPLERGQAVRIEPGGMVARVRELQVHNRSVERVTDGGRTAVNLAGVEAEALRRGQVLATDPGAIAVTDRLLVALRSPAGPGRGERSWGEGETLRLHVATESADVIVSRAGRAPIALPGGETVALLRLDRPVAAAAGDRFALRRPSPSATVAGGRILDLAPARGPSRRRVTAERLGALAGAPDAAAHAAARLELHGIGPAALASDVRDRLETEALAAVADHHAQEPDSAGLPLGELRAALARTARRLVSASPPEAASAARGVLDGLVAAGRLSRDGDRVRDPARTPGPSPALTAAMERLEAALDVNSPPSLAEAARAAGCPPEGVRALVAAGRIVRLEDDLAYATRTYRSLETLALELARRGPLAPAEFRDASGTSRRFALAILEDLDRRGLLRRTPDGHVPGPRAPTPAGREE